MKLFNGSFIIKVIAGDVAMTQYQQPQYQNPYDNTGMQPPRKISGLAITALILSIIGLIPCIGVCTAPFGVLLGLIATFTTGGAKKGRGLAIAALLLGIVGCLIQYGVGRWGYEKFIVPVMEGPKHVLNAGYAGNLQGFRNASAAPMTNATDAEITAFIETLRSRYGAFQNVMLDEQAQQGQQPPFGQAQADFPYIFEFENATVNGECLFIFADQQTGQMIIKPGTITIYDPSLGDMTFPPSAAVNTPPVNGAGNGSTDADGAADENGELDVDPVDIGEEDGG